MGKVLGVEYRVTIKIQNLGTNLEYIGDKDLGTIFVNLLDNAIEAAKGSEKKTIEVNLWREEYFDFVVIKNSCSKALNIKDNLPLTTKEDKNHHGYGLENVKKALKKYQTHIDFFYEEEVFKILIKFPKANV